MKLISSKAEFLDYNPSNISLIYRVASLTQEFTRLLHEVEKCEAEGKQMQARIDEYQDYARRIHILGA
jgi:hypothetical protein